VLVAVISAGSIIFGNLAALAQRRYGRMLAFSGIAQVGYGLLAVATGNGRALLLFAAGYALAVSGAFLAAGVFRARRPEWDGSIAGLAGIAREAPVVAASVSVMLLSATGIPPLLGFWGKFLVFLNAASTDLVWLVVLAVLGSVVSFGYYGRVMRVMYFEDSTPDDRHAILDEREALVTTRRTEVAVVLLAVVIVLLGAYLLVGGLAPAVGTNQVYGALQLLPFAQ
jgi:NADH-quinone oxidoreductase subunit N